MNFLMNKLSWNLLIKNSVYEKFIFNCLYKSKSENIVLANLLLGQCVIWFVGRYS